MRAIRQLSHLFSNAVRKDGACARFVGPADQWHVKGDRWQQIVEALQECGREDLGVGQQGTLMAVERAEGGKFIQ